MLFCLSEFVHSADLQKICQKKYLTVFARLKASPYEKVDYYEARTNNLLSPLKRSKYIYFGSWISSDYRKKIAIDIEGYIFNKVLAIIMVIIGVLILFRQKKLELEIVNKGLNLQDKFVVIADFSCCGSEYRDLAEKNWSTSFFKSNLLYKSIKT